MADVRTVWLMLYTMFGVALTGIVLAERQHDLYPLWFPTFLASGVMWISAMRDYFRADAIEDVNLWLAGCMGDGPKVKHPEDN